jgi:gluconate 5-dehydrogenase
VDQLTRYAAGALAEYGIRVNAVTPGPFPNPNNQNDAEFNAKLAGKTMLGRFGQSYEMAGAVLLLASDASSFMTGTNIVVDGGWTAW